MPLPAFSALSRRSVLQLAVAGAALSGFSACAATPKVYTLAVNRDAGCGCCQGWMTLMQRSDRFTATMRDEPDMLALKRRLGVPGDLASCHTAEVEGYVIEGHVPSTDIVRLLEQRPTGVRGLAVPGMPIGSPGMEQGAGGRDAFDVFAFRADGGRDVFAHYAAQS
jgi:hypothetical protein